MVCQGKKDLMMRACEGSIGQLTVVHLQYRGDVWLWRARTD